MAEQSSVEVFSNDINRVILRTSGRHFPGIVLQGDTLRGLLRLSERLFSRLPNESDDELLDDAEDLRDRLKELLIHYENVLMAHHMELPYPPQDYVCGRHSPPEEKKGR